MKTMQNTRLEEHNVSIKQFVKKKSRRQGVWILAEEIGHWPMPKPRPCCVEGDSMGVGLRDIWELTHITPGFLEAKFLRLAS